MEIAHTYDNYYSVFHRKNVNEYDCLANGDYHMDICLGLLQKSMGECAIPL